MKYWWVNQNQTSIQEIEGGYLWSPKFARGNRPLPAYENMKGIEPGDIIFSYHDQVVSHYGIATNRAMSSPKPEEFGKAGMYWDDSGWYVAVRWEELGPIPRDAIGHDWEKYFTELETPFTVNRTVKQAYLFQICKRASERIFELAHRSLYEGYETAQRFEPLFFGAEAALDDLVESSIVQRTDLESTVKESIVQARRGQGLFKENLYRIEKACRITGVDDQKLLVASHIKPWRACETNHQKLDGNNGLLLTPTIDRLFDRRYLTFENDGAVVLSKKISDDNYERIGLNTNRKLSVGRFNSEQERYLEYHRSTFLE